MVSLSNCYTLWRKFKIDVSCYFHSSPRGVFRTFSSIKYLDPVRRRPVCAYICGNRIPSSLLENYLRYHKKCKIKGYAKTCSYPLPSTPINSHPLPLIFNPLPLIFSPLPPTLSNFQPTTSTHTHFLGVLHVYMH